jgi:hypothetical protein
MGRKIESQAQRREPAALEVVDGTTSFAKNIRYQIPFLLNLSSVLAGRETFSSFVSHNSKRI